MSAARRHDVAIYAPHASTYYSSERAGGGNRRSGGGGAELQTFLIATSLARAGVRVAHIVFAVEDPVPGGADWPSIVERPDRPVHGRPWYGLVEAVHVWRAMGRANARAYVFRGGGKHLGVGAVFCFLHRRKLVLSGSSDLDFDVPRRIHTRLGRVIYRFGLRRCARVIVQTRQQAAIARGVLGDGAPISQIPNFAELVAPVEPTGEVTAFLWAGRVAEYKLPLRYLELASALPEVPFRMVAARSADTTDELEASISERAADLANLELLPSQPREDLLDLISHSAGVVNTSTVEGMPNVFLEAWARGVPALSLHVDPDGTIAACGLGVAAGGSWEVFVDGARRLWKDAGLRGEIGEAARRYVAETHAPGAVEARWVAVLREILNDPGPVPST